LHLNKERGKKGNVPLHAVKAYEGSEVFCCTHCYQSTRWR